MKILAFTDTHSNKAKIKILKKAYSKNKPDLLICAGDFTKMGRKLKQNLLDLHFGKKLLFIPGNHEEHKIFDFDIKS